MALTAEQRRNLAIARRESRGDSRRVRLSLIEAMKVESNYRNLNYGDRDSRGVLQQRRQYYPHSGQNVKYDIDQYLMRARRADRGFHGSPGALAQAVQRSAFPGRYDEHAQEAQSLLGGPMASGSSLGAASPYGANGGVSGASQPMGQNPMFAQLIASSNELAAGHMPNSSDLLMALAEQRQAAQMPSAPAQQVAGQVQGQAVPRTGGQIKWEGNMHGLNQGFVSKLSAALTAIGGTAVRIRSGYRSPAHNRAVGGASNSNHMYGHAIDGDVYIRGRGWVPLGQATRGIASRYGLRSGSTFTWGGRPDIVHVDDGYNQH